MKIVVFFYAALLFSWGCYHRSTPSLQADVSQSCGDKIADGNCGYYDCLESKFKCGAAGYPLAYGKFYCQRFNSFCGNALSGLAARQWVMGTTACLKRELSFFERSLRSCDDVTATAFNSHTNCYTDGSVAHGGVSFCSLTPTDWTSVTRCINLTDRLSRRGIQQMAMTARKCGQMFLTDGLFLNDGTGDLKPDPQTEAQIKSMTSIERETRAQEFFDFADHLLTVPGAG